jgi:hypothetical protein
MLTGIIIIFADVTHIDQSAGSHTCQASRDSGYQQMDPQTLPLLDSGSVAIK